MGMIQDEQFLDSINKLNKLENQSIGDIESWEKVEEKTIINHSSLDGWDYCFAIAIGLVSSKITTSEKLENYLNDIHYAASGNNGEYTNLQKILGKLLYHKGDNIDILDKGFTNRKGNAANIGFHRLLWGHDILSIGPDNPFYLMIKQKGLFGVLQTVRHLLADTMSKQGLPLPGSSFLDYEKDGKLSNYLIDISNKLSEESVGNKRNAQKIYSHMFTLKGQDIIGGGVVSGFCKMYFNYRNIEDQIRIVQFRLIAYTVAFFGQAMIGCGKQSGVPYVNCALAGAMFKNLIQLYYYSNRETKLLRIKTNELIEQGNIYENMVLDDERWIEEMDNIDYLDEEE